jgi:hypothetical protein
MSGEDDKLEDFGRRTGAMLRASAEELDAQTRSRLSRARAAALEDAGSSGSWLSTRYLAPAGAVACAALVALLLVGRDPSQGALGEPVPAALYDLELLADADAFALSQEADLEFIEWAAAMAELEGAGG